MINKEILLNTFIATYFGIYLNNNNFLSIIFTLIQYIIFIYIGAYLENKYHKFNDQNSIFLDLKTKSYDIFTKFSTYFINQNQESIESQEPKTNDPNLKDD